MRVLNKLLLPLIAGVFVLAILAFMCTYTVRFTEVAVVTTFGAARDGSVQTEPGLRFKAPYPFQSVTKYDKRIRVVQTRSDTQQTADNSQVVVESFATYRVSDPLLFFRAFSSAGDRAIDHFRLAESSILRDALRSAMGETSKYRMSELFTVERGASRLPELEERILQLMTRREVDGVSLDDYGIEVVSVGIDRIVLPEDTTQSVMRRMGEARNRLAQELESEGEAEARAIRSGAQSDREKILAFAHRRAQEIRARGEQEAAPFLAQQSSEPDLAVFLQNIELMRDAMSKRITLVLSTSDFGLGLFNPDVLRDLQAGELPTRVMDEEWLSGRTGDGSSGDER